MKGKIYIWLVALVAVIGILVLSEKLSNKKPAEKSAKFFPDASEKNISAFVVTDSKGTVKIRKKGDIWVIDQQNSAGSGFSATNTNQSPAQSPAKREYQADSASVASVLEKIASMKKINIVSQNPQKQGIFEVDSVNGVLVEVFNDAGKSFGSIRIGKNGPDWSSQYVRLIGTNDVYLVGGSIKYAFFSDEKQWRDKIVQKLDQNNVTKITLAKKSALPIIIEKSTDTAGTAQWNLVEPEKAAVKADQASELLNALSFFTCADFEDSLVSDSAMGFLAPELVATVTLKDGSKKSITVGALKADAQKYWVRADGKDINFLVMDSEIAKLDKNTETLKGSAGTDVPVSK